MCLFDQILLLGSELESSDGEKLRQKFSFECLQFLNGVECALLRPTCRQFNSLIDYKLTQHKNFFQHQYDQLYQHRLEVRKEYYECDKQITHIKNIMKQQTEELQRVKHSNITPDEKVHESLKLELRLRELNEQSSECV
uniref:Uncharacterized protein n=1 Tax=Ditylenchus dipsaci TaxID=166011 RepID=A0A915DSA4_9BILA